MKPVCIPCHMFYRSEHTGFKFIEGMPDGNNVQPGMAEADRWKPYKLWVGDRWKCPGCGHEIICGFGSGPIDEHYTKTFADNVRAHGATYQVNDC